MKPQDLTHRLFFGTYYLYFEIPAKTIAFIPSQFQDLKGNKYDDIYLDCICSENGITSWGSSILAFYNNSRGSDKYQEILPESLLSHKNSRIRLLAKLMLKKKENILDDFPYGSRR